MSTTSALSYAPAPKILQTNNNNIMLTNKKSEPKKIKKVSTRMANPNSISVARRNARERNRVKQVNHGFATLRQHIPPEITALFEQQSNGKSQSKKLSKVETLRMAVEYIRTLEDILSFKTKDSTQFKTENEENLQPDFFEDVPEFTFEDNSFQQSSILSSPPYYSDQSLSPTSSVDTMYQPQFVTLPPIEVIQRRSKDVIPSSVITSVPGSIIFYTSSESFSSNVYIKTESDELTLNNGIVKSEEMIDVMDWWGRNDSAMSPESDERRSSN